MANEIGFRGAGTGKTHFVLVRNGTNQIWNGTSFVAYATADFTTYDVVASEQGTSSNYYVASFPSTIAAGIYGVEARQQLGGSPAETDPTVAQGDFHWDGTVVIPLANLATSGQLGQAIPIRLARGTMITNYPIYFRSAADHVTPFTSGVVSGQISRDGGSFGVLQSGNFSEVGLGHFNLGALTSGDLLANTVRLHFTAVGISGGSADPVPITIVLQRSSGQ